MAKRWLQSVDLEIDEQGKPSFESALEALAALIESGRLKVDAAGVTLTCDLIDLDVEAITGAPPDASTLYDLAVLLTSIDGDTGSMATDLAALAGLDFATQTTLAAQALDVSMSDTRLGDIQMSAGVGIAQDITLQTVDGRLGNIEMWDYATQTTLEQAMTGINAITNSGSKTLEDVAAEIMNLQGMGAQTLSEVVMEVLNLQGAGSKTLTEVVSELEDISAWNEAGRAAVNLITSQAGVAGGVGNVGDTVLRMLLANDDPHFGAVGAAADVDGVIHGQLRYLGDQLAAIKAKTDLLTFDGSNHLEVHTN